MKNIMKGLIKKKYLKFSTKREDFLKNLKLLGQKTTLENKNPEPLKNPKTAKIQKSCKTSKTQIETLFEKYLEKINTDEMDPQELLLSPLLSAENKKKTDFHKKILSENLKKISLLKEKKKKYSIPLIDKSLGNMEWFLKNEKKKYENLYNSEPYSKLSFVEKDFTSDFFDQQFFHPEDLEHDKIAILNYKGSKKGPRIEDDLESFLLYWKNSMSDSRFFFLKKMEFFYQGEKNEKEGGLMQTHDLFLLDEWAEEFRKYEKNEIEEIEEFYGEERKKKPHLTDLERNLNFDIEHNATRKVALDFVNDDDLPDIPHVFKHDNTDYQAYMTYWGVMKTILNLQKQKKSQKQIISKILEKAKQKPSLATSKTSSKNSEILNKNKKTPTPSILPYYNLLPKFLREDQTIKTLTITLEKHSPNLSLEKKQKLINEISQYILPLKKADEIYAESELRSTRKYYATREDEIHLEKQNDKDMSINSKKKILLDNMKKLDDTAMPERDFDIFNCTDKVEGNPIDFYDNDDGFWDGFLEGKRKGLEEYPIFDSPAFFK